MGTLIAETHVLIPTLCRQFSQATGWTLHYTPADTESFAELETQAANDPRCCWFQEISDGREPVGLLSLFVADDLASNCSFVQATDLAQGISEVLVQLATAFARLDRRNHDVSTLVHLGLAVPAQENLAWALTQVLKAAVQLTTTRSAAFFLLNPETSRLKLRAVYQIAADLIPRSERILAYSPEDLEALVTGPAAVYAQEGTSSVSLPESFRAGLCVAVQSETMPIGTLWVYDRRSRQFGERDRHVLQSIAMQIAAVLERVALLKHSESHDRIRRELKTASESAPGIAPHEQLPTDPRFEIAAYCASCYELGGDLCELIPIDADELAIVIGDASGNSIPAAVIMSAMRGAVRAYPAGSDAVIPLMQRLNSALYEITRSHQFMSLCYGVFDARRKTFTYSNAGHPTPLLLRNGTISTLTSHGLLLGVMRDVEYETSTLELQTGDLLVCYTDGISEARNSTQKMFRSEGIAEAVQHCSGGSSAADVLKAVWSRVESHMAGGEPGDDRTLLVLKVR